MIESVLSIKYGRGQLKCDGTRAETRFRLSGEKCAPSAVVMLDKPCSEVV